jgi:thiol-disulfide isomerase/thioredoxin
MKAPPHGSFSRRHLLQAAAVSLAGAVTAPTRGAAQSAPAFKTTGGQFVFLEPRPVLPAVHLTCLDGTAVDLRRPSGKPRLISIWATWCPPCRRELPTLARVLALLGKNVEVTPVCIDRASSRVQVFIDRLGVRLPTALDPTGLLVRPPTEDPPPPIAMWGMPISYIVDRNGRVAGYLAGEADWSSPGGIGLLQYFSAQDA